jgi:hypothetical protein
MYEKGLFLLNDIKKPQTAENTLYLTDDQDEYSEPNYSYESDISDDSEDEY